MSPSFSSSSDLSESTEHIHLAAALHDTILYALLWYEGAARDRWQRRTTRVDLRGIWDDLTTTQDVGRMAHSARLLVLEDQLEVIRPNISLPSREITTRLFGTFRRFIQQTDCHISLFPTKSLSEKRSTLRVLFNNIFRVSGSSSRIVPGLDWVVLESSPDLTRTKLLEQGFDGDSLVKTDKGGVWKICLGPGSLQRKACQRCFYTTAFDSETREKVFLSQTRATWPLQKGDEAFMQGGPGLAEELCDHPDHDLNISTYSAPAPSKVYQRTLSLCLEWQDNDLTIPSMRRSSRPPPISCSSPVPLCETMESCSSPLTPLPDTPSSLASPITPYTTYTSSENGDDSMSSERGTPPTSPVPIQARQHNRGRISQRRIRSPTPSSPEQDDVSRDISFAEDSRLIRPEVEVVPGVFVVEDVEFDGLASLADISGGVQKTFCLKSREEVKEEVLSDPECDTFPVAQILLRTPISKAIDTIEEDIEDDLDILGTPLNTHSLSSVTPRIPPNHSMPQPALASSRSQRTLSTTPASGSASKRKSCRYRINAMLKLHRESATRAVRQSQRLGVAKKRIRELEKAVQDMNDIQKNGPEASESTVQDGVNEAVGTEIAEAKEQSPSAESLLDILDALAAETEFQTSDEKAASAVSSGSPSGASPNIAGSPPADRDDIVTPLATSGGQSTGNAPAMPECCINTAARTALAITVQANQHIDRLQADFDVRVAKLQNAQSTMHQSLFKDRETTAGQYEQEKQRLMADIETLRKDKDTMRSDRRERQQRIKTLENEAARLQRDLTQAMGSSQGLQLRLQQMHVDAELGQRKLQEMSREVMKRDEQMGALRRERNWAMARAAEVQMQGEMGQNGGNPVMFPLAFEQGNNPPRYIQAPYIHANRPLQSQQSNAPRSSAGMSIGSLEVLNQAGHVQSTAPSDRRSQQPTPPPSATLQQGNFGMPLQPGIQALRQPVRHTTPPVQEPPSRQTVQQPVIQQISRFPPQHPYPPAQPTVPSQHGSWSNQNVTVQPNFDTRAPSSLAPQPASRIANNQAEQSKPTRPNLTRQGETTRPDPRTAVHPLHQIAPQPAHQPAPICQPIDQTVHQVNGTQPSIEPDSVRPTPISASRSTPDVWSIGPVQIDAYGGRSG